MRVYAGLDVSLKTTQICVVDEEARIVWRGVSASDPASIHAELERFVPDLVRCALETGSTSPWLTSGLRELGMPAVCVDARHAKPVLAQLRNKTDRNDARVLADLARTLLFRQVYVKPRQAQELRAALEARQQLVEAAATLKTTIRGLLKPFGLILGAAGYSCRRGITAAVAALRASDRGGRFTPDPVSPSAGQWATSKPSAAGAHTAWVQARPFCGSSLIPKGGHRSWTRPCSKQGLRAGWFEEQSCRSSEGAFQLVEWPLSAGSLSRSATAPSRRSLAMLDPTKLLANALGEHLAATYRRAFGSREPRFAEVLEAAARLTIERIGGSDALYHDDQHTALVTLVAQDILLGRFVTERLTPEDWLHAILSALYHDVGYVRGICSGDTAKRFVVAADGTSVELPRGASDAALSPHHVERSKIAVRERFHNHSFIDAERIARAVELTRFPVPTDGDHGDTATEAGYMRAADLIGQLGDPLYPRKLNALFHEFAEVGMNEELGYASPADLAERYPAFFWSQVEPVIGDAIQALDKTVEGRRWVASLYAHVFAIEHDRRRMGPHQG